MGFGFGSPTGNGGTEFLSMLPPPKGDLHGYDNTRPYSQQPATIPQIFRDAMSVREEVYGEQGVPLEAEFDEDDARSWHWVVYASVASTASSPPKDLRTDARSNGAEDARRASASASRLPVGTIRLIPAPHAPNKYIDNSEGQHADKHADASPPAGSDASHEQTHPTEPYVKLGRLSVLAPYRKLGLAKLLINTALDYATKNHETIYQPPSPTAMEMASLRRDSVPEAVSWNGLVMIHAQASLQTLWERYGFAEELKNEDGKVQVAKEPHWIEEGIEHVGMWKRLKIDNSRS
jgi:predicted GNAT family N-acyltransferase